MIRFTESAGQPAAPELRKIEEFYASIFEKIDSEKFTKRMTESENLLTILAFHEDRIVGFKIGYRIAPTTFYSWIGGVDEKFRQNGIAAELMKRQHDWCARNGFEKVRTKTQNRFKAMLILNIKNGFEIIGVYRNARNESRIVLEKTLREN